MKILYVTTIGSTMGFFPSLIRELIGAGHQVDIATNERIRPVPDVFREMGCRVHQISCTRNPLSKTTLTAVKELRGIVEQGDYQIVHCHTPVAAVSTRLACRQARKRGVRVFYTAHGFHFCKGAPLINWLLYYPMEKWLSRYTDVLITINQEDYQLARRHFRAGETCYVPGVGFDTKRFMAPRDGRKIREELDIGSRFMLLSVGELNDNKNHATVIRALAQMDHSRMVYVVVGRGERKDQLQALAKETGVQLILTGFRTDVPDFYAAADAYIHPSFREGLSMALLEAMASGLPCLGGRIRGPGDLLDEQGGFTFNPASVPEVADAIGKVLACSREKLGAYNREKARKFDIRIVNDAMFRIYGLTSAE